MAVFSSFFVSCSGDRPQDLGVQNGHLKGCPPSPNCVSTTAVDEKHKIDPINVPSDMMMARKKIEKILNETTNAKIIDKNENYFQVEYTSKLLRFVDDVELFLDEKEKKIQMRSSSRLGHSDFGVNRSRLENIRFQFHQMGNLP